MVVKRKHTTKPVMVGTNQDTTVHFILWVSFRMVRQVVEQGQCIKEKRRVLTAVTQVQPLFTRSSFNTDRSSISKSFPSAIYAMIIIGTTISLAGNPRINARRMTPSSPMALANGSRKPEQRESMVASPMVRFAISQITIPAGAATTTARPSTNRVRSNMERTMTLPICGLL